MKRIKKWIALLLSAALLCLAACAAQEQPAPDPISEAAGSSTEQSKPASSKGDSEGILPGITTENFPQIDGSTANLPLMAEVYSRVCGVPLVDAQTSVSEARGTSEAWRSLVSGYSDLLLVYEAPETVRQELEDSRVDLEVTPIGRDGLVFLVNQKNPVDNLTQKQLQDIYTAAVTDWKEVGGDDRPIAAFQRNEESGSQTLFLKLLMKDLTPMQAPTELRRGMMADLIDAVAAYDGSSEAIGYSVYYYAEQMYQNPDLKLLAVDGVKPTDKTIADQSYPLTNEFYVAIRENEPEDSPARRVRDWLLTKQGRKALKAAGYVPAF